MTPTLPREHFNLGTDVDLSDKAPLTQEIIDSFGPNTMVSPFPGFNHLEAFGIEDVAPPGSAQYEKEHEDVEALRILVESGVWPEEFLAEYGVEPRLSPPLSKYADNILTREQLREHLTQQELRRYRGISESTPKLCGELVKMDTPLQFYDEIIMPYTMEHGITINPEFVHHEGVPFVESNGAKVQAHVWIQMALKAAFETKTALLRARPSERNSMGSIIEAYPCPHHGEAPAGHGTFCGASVAAVTRLTNATPVQIIPVANTGKQIAMFRSFSGVHIPSSNMLGYELGYRYVMAAPLTPGLLI